MNKQLILFLLVLWTFFIFFNWVDARAWGWGGGWWGGSWSWEGSWVAAVIIGLYYAIYEIRRRKMISKAKKDLQIALQEDSSWDIASLKRSVTDIFFQYQNDWQSKSTLNMMQYMTKKYHAKATKTLERQLKWKKNILNNIHIKDLTLMSVRDNPWKNWDMFAMEVSASMIDYTIDQSTWKFIWSTLTREKNESFDHYKDRAMHEASDFKEYYIFIRHNWKWLLNNVKQKFSIIWDVIWLSESQLRTILKQEKDSDFTSDDVLYTD